MIVPPPETIDHVPPAGVAVKDLVWFSSIELVVVLFVANTQFVGKQLLL